MWSASTAGELRIFDFPQAIKDQGRVNMTTYPLVNGSYEDDGSTVSMWPNGTVTAHVKRPGNRIFPTMVTIQG